MTEKTLDLFDAPITMSSREIADLVQSRHDDVKRSIERLAERGVVTLPPLAEVFNDGPGPKFVSVYNVSKRDSYIIVAQLSPEFTAALVDRWQELEAAPREMTRLELLDMARDSEVRRLKAEETIEVQSKALALAAPKTAFYDRVVERDGLMTATQVGQKLKLSAVKLNQALDLLEVYNQGLKRGRAFRQWFVDKGFGIMKQTEAGYPQPLFTTSGGAWVVEKMIAEGY